MNIAIDEELSYKEALKQKNAGILEKIIMKRALDLAEETVSQHKGSYKSQCQFTEPSNFLGSQ